MKKFLERLIEEAKRANKRLRIKSKSDPELSLIVSPEKTLILNNGKEKINFSPENFSSLKLSDQNLVKQLVFLYFNSPKDCIISFSPK